MLTLGAIPGWLQFLELVVGIVVGILALTATGALAVYTVRRAKIVSEDVLAQSAVTSLTGELSAWKARVSRQDDQIDGLKAVNAAQQETIVQLNERSAAQDRRIDDLTELVTGSHKIDALAAMTRAAFVHLGVPPESLPFEPALP